MIESYDFECRMADVGRLKYVPRLLADEFCILQRGSFHDEVPGEHVVFPLLRPDVHML